MARRRTVVVGASWALAGLVALGPRPTRADCPADAAVASSSIDPGSVDARLSFLRSQMQTGARRSRGWALGWGLTYGVAAIAQFAALPHVSPGTRRDLYVGASSATIGVLTRSIMIPRVIGAHRRLERSLRRGEDRCATLQAAERDLARAARSEAFGRSLLLHLAAIGYNVAIGVVLGVGLDRPLSGLRQATIGATVGQIMLVTQPTTMIDARTRYRSGRLDPAPIPYLRPLSLRGGGGLVVGGRF